MNKLGIAAPDFGANQLGYLAITKTNEYLLESYDVDVIGFYENLVRYSISPNFACMQAVELWGYDGPVVACSLNLAQDVLKIPTVADKYFYIWDLEWIHLVDKDYGKLKEVYSNMDLKLITRSQDYADIIKKVWNRKVDYVVEDFETRKLVEIICNQH